jgi:hypothetical protein
MKYLKIQQVKNFFDLLTWIKEKDLKVGYFLVKRT